MSIEYPRHLTHKLIESIKASVSPVPKRLLDGSKTLDVLPGSDQRIIWVPQRRALKHALFTIPNQLNGRKRKSALELKIDGWSPFDNTGYAVAWSDNEASVFIWDQDALITRIQEAGYEPRICEVVPEAFMRRPIQDGVRLVKSFDGLEAQAWNEGVIKSTRWWADMPPKHEWSLFTRAAGVSKTLDAATIEEPDWLEVPWNETALSGNIFTQAVRNDRLVVAGSAFLLFPCIFFALQWFTYTVMAASNTQTIAAVEAESRPLRADRSRALSALESAEDLVSLNPYPHQIEVLSRAHNILQPFTVTLANWDYDEGALEFGILSDGDMDARLLISAFEEDPLFSSVSSGTVGQRLVMRMDVKSENGEQR